MSSSNKDTRLNEWIRAREVRLVGDDGAQLGIQPIADALKMARDLDLDLVEVASNATPPVCRIMDYAKFKYEEEQQAKAARKKATNITVKEMKYRVKIGPGDFETKTRKVTGFLHEGHKVKVTIMFRGREVERPQFGADILNRIADNVSEFAMVEMEARLDGRNMTMVLAPGKPKRARVPLGEQATAEPEAVETPETEVETPAEAATQDESTDTAESTNEETK